MQEADEEDLEKILQIFDGAVSCGRPQRRGSLRAAATARAAHRCCPHGRVAARVQRRSWPGTRSASSCAPPSVHRPLRCVAPADRGACRLRCAALRLQRPIPVAHVLGNHCLRLPRHELITA